MKYGYARVSTFDQDTAIQQETLKRYGCDVIRAENASGAKTEGREQLKTLLEFMREGDMLVVCKLDRLARNTIDMLTIITALGDKGIAFISLAEPWANTDTPAGKLMLTVMAGVATFERERIRERQLEGIAKAKADGKYKGRKPTPRDKVAAVIELDAAGKGVAAIVRETGLGRSTVYRILDAAQETEDLNTVADAAIRADGCTENEGDIASEPSNTDPINSFESF